MNISFPVKKGKFQLHRNIEKEDEEARNSMAACIEALNSIQSLNPDGKRFIGTIIIFFLKYELHGQIVECFKDYIY